MQSASAIVTARAGEATAPVSIAGAEMLCDWTGCLYWPAENTLIVSDLHLEKGSSYARTGQFLPPYDTLATLVVLDEQIWHWKPARVIALGDSFHDGKAGDRMDSQALIRLQNLVSRQEWIWISGNHDPEPPGFVGGHSYSDLAIGPLTFRHEPVSGAKGEICGHLHPHARIHRRGKTVRRRCFAHDGNRLVMPAFGAYTGGLNIRHQAFAGLFVEENLRANVLGQERIYPISGENLI